MGLTGKLALVTGGGRGIGRAICQVLARENASVVVSDLSLDSCNQTLESLPPQSSHLPVESDVSSKDSVKQCFDQILEKYKRAPDIIVNSAGITKDGFMLRMKEEDFDKVMDVNLKGTFLVTQLGSSLMKQQSIHGSIVNISSIVGRTGNIGQANYAASKAGVIGFTKTASKELGGFGIRVNVILPGFIKTPMTDVIPDKVKALTLSRVSLGAMGEPEDIANAALFLASQRSRYITGACLDVNGGMD